MIRLSDEILKAEGYEDLVAKKVKAFTHDMAINLKTLFETTTTGAANSASVESTRTGEYESLLGLASPCWTSFPS